MELQGRLYAASIAPDAREAALRWGLGVEVDTFCTAACMEQAESRAAAERLLQGVSRRVLHAPFNELCPAAIDPLAVELAQKRFEQAWALAQKLDIHRMVVHSGFIPLIYDRGWFLEKSTAFWKRFLADKPAELELLIENVLEDDPGLLCALVQAVDDPRFRLCLDVGHANTPVSAVPVLEWANRCLPWLGHVHLHNNDGSWDSHSGLDGGSIPMQELLTLLTQGAPSATFTLEVLEAEPACRWLAAHDWMGGWNEWNGKRS